MGQKLQETFGTWKNQLGVLMKWSIMSVLVGGIVGVIGSIFSYAVSYATAFREAHYWVVFGLPLGGLFIVWMYKIAGQEKNTGTNLVLNVIRSHDGDVPRQVAPLILISTVITHFFGGSSGREGAALQFGASVAGGIGRRFHLSESDEKIIILSGMSAAFAALFGTPMAAAIFPMEVVSVGIMYYSALVPCMFASFTAQHISVLMKVRTVGYPYLIEEVPDFYSIEALKCVVLAVCFALAGVLFCILLHTCERKFKEWLANPYLRVVAGAAAVIALRFILGTEEYLGLGDDVIHVSFYEAASPEKFFLKMIFTCLTLCVGFKGGEIVPTLFIGATLGSALSPLLQLSPAICAACGMVGVFCAVTNSPITSMLIAFELFGSAGMPFYCIVVSISYLLSGYYSLYKEQKIVYSKTENKYVDRRTH